MASATAPAGKPEGTLPRRCHHLIPTPRDVHTRLRCSRYILGERSNAKAVVRHGWGTWSHRHLASRMRSHCCPWHSPASPEGRIQPQRGEDPCPQPTAPMGCVSPGAESAAQGTAWVQLPFPTPRPPHSRLFWEAEHTPTAAPLDAAGDHHYPCTAQCRSSSCPQAVSVGSASPPQG